MHTCKHSILYFEIKVKVICSYLSIFDILCNFRYETSNGVSRSETAELKNLGTDQEAIAIRGVISWTDNEGNKYNLEFVADENGFQPKGDHLPHN